MKYRIRFLSAKPIRAAFARMIALQQENSETRRRVLMQMQEFVDRDFGEYVAVAVTFEATDQRFSGKALQAFSSAAAGTLKNNTYLERKDGKRVFLMDYRPLGSDGLGAKFVFPRTVDGKPFLAPESGDVRFVSEVSNTIKLNMRFKVGDMIYDDELEY